MVKDDPNARVTSMIDHIGGVFGFIFSKLIQKLVIVDLFIGLPGSQIISYLIVIIVIVQFTTTLYICSVIAFIMVFNIAFCIFDY